MVKPKFSIIVIVVFLYAINVHSQGMSHLIEKIPAEVDSSSIHEAEESTKSKLVYMVHWLKSSEIQFVDQTSIDPHFLGLEIAKKRYLLEETFVRRVPIAPGNPSMRAEITKPILVKAVNDVERHLSRGVRGSNLCVNKATEQMNIVLDVVLNTYYLDTAELEQKVRDARGAEQLLQVFTENVKVMVN